MTGIGAGTYGTGIVAGGVASAVGGSSFAAGAGAMATFAVPSMLGVGTSVAWIPIVGWGVTVAALATAGVLAIIPDKIELIPEIIILAGPYMIEQ
jgi:hypothetical protein